jgi:hypothetical protein
MCFVPATSHHVVRGTVLDSTSREGVPFARISVVGGDNATLSSPDGSFAIAVDSLPALIHVHHLGYSATTIEFSFMLRQLN